jgi:hypothetical protein
LPTQPSDIPNWVVGDPDSIASYARTRCSVATASNGETIDLRATCEQGAIDDQRGLTIKGPPALDADGHERHSPDNRTGWV